MSMTGLNSPTMIPRKTEAHIIPRFFTQEIEVADQIDPTTGLKMFRVVEFVELLSPGDKTSAPVKRVNEAIKAMYRDAYTRFKSGGVDADMIGDGIPLKLWPGIKSEVARGLEHINIFTVQQLASLADGKCSQPGTLGLRELRDKAKAFLETVGQTAPLAALQAQIDEMKKTNSLRDEQLKQALERAEAAEAKLGGPSAADRMPELTTPRGRQKTERE